MFSHKPQKRNERTSYVVVCFQSQISCLSFSSCLYMDFIKFYNRRGSILHLEGRYLFSTKAFHGFLRKQGCSHASSFRLK